MKCTEEKFEAFIHFRDLMGGYAATKVDYNEIDEELLQEATGAFGVAPIKKAIKVWNEQMREAEMEAICSIRQIFKIDG